MAIGRWGQVGSDTTVDTLPLGGSESQLRGGRPWQFGICLPKDMLVCLVSPCNSELHNPPRSFLATLPRRSSSFISRFFLAFALPANLVSPRFGLVPIETCSLPDRINHNVRHCPACPGRTMFPGSRATLQETAPHAGKLQWWRYWRYSNLVVNIAPCRQAAMVANNVKSATHEHLGAGRSPREGGVNDYLGEPPNSVKSPVGRGRRLSGGRGLSIPQGICLLSRVPTCRRTRVSSNYQLIACWSNG